MTRKDRDHDYFNEIVVITGSEFVLYDNGSGSEDDIGNGGTTPLSGGSITVHRAKKK